MGQRIRNSVLQVSERHCGPAGRRTNPCPGDDRVAAPTSRQSLAESRSWKDLSRRSASAGVPVRSPHPASNPAQGLATETERWSACLWPIDAGHPVYATSPSSTEDLPPHRPVAGGPGRSPIPNLGERDRRRVGDEPRLSSSVLRRLLDDLGSVALFLAIDGAQRSWEKVAESFKGLLRNQATHGGSLKPRAGRPSKRSCRTDPPYTYPRSESC
jgi:hypothetical protein